jgi:hypothetical protein
MMFDGSVQSRTGALSSALRTQAGASPVAGERWARRISIWLHPLLVEIVMLLLAAYCSFVSDLSIDAT